MIFVLSSKENIINIYEKNLEEIPFSKYDVSNKQSINLNENPNFFKTLIDGVINQIDKDMNNDKIEDQSKAKNRKNNNESKEDTKFNLFNNRNKKKNKSNSKTKEDEKKKNVKFLEIDQMQDNLDKSMNILTNINNKSQDMTKNVDKFVKQEIVNEITVYISKNDMKK